MCAIVDEVLEEGLVVTLCRCNQERPDMVRWDVDVSADLSNQQSYNMQVTVVSCDEQGRGSFVLCLVDVSSELVHEAAHQFQITARSSDGQGRRPILNLLCLVDVNTKFIH
jgi:hypothetical protein